MTYYVKFSFFKKKMFLSLVHNCTAGLQQLITEEEKNAQSHSVYRFSNYCVRRYNAYFLRTDGQIVLVILPCGEFSYMYNA